MVYVVIGLLVGMAAVLVAITSVRVSRQRHDPYGSLGPVESHREHGPQD